MKFVRQLENTTEHPITDHGFLQKQYRNKSLQFFKKLMIFLLDI